MKLSQLSLADYNQLDSIPVINQDLSASGFTPVANTYYRHTGATTATFTQGVIYLYDTAYHKLGESGGTTLNKYTWTLDLTQTVSSADRMRLRNILLSAKGRVMGNILVWSSNYGLQPSEGNNPNLSGTHVTYDGTNYSVMYFYVLATVNSLDISGYKVLSSKNAETYTRDNNNPSSTTFKKLKVIYFNDAEITA